MFYTNFVNLFEKLVILMSQIRAPNLRNNNYSINNKLKLIIID